jgi:hypothetical protein
MTAGQSGLGLPLNQFEGATLFIFFRQGFKYRGIRARKDSLYNFEPFLDLLLGRSVAGEEFWFDKDRKRLFQIKIVLGQGGLG